MTDPFGANVWLTDRDFTGRSDFNLLPVRPVWPGMLNAEDLTVGRLVRRHHKGTSGDFLYRVTSEPADGWVTLVYVSPESARKLAPNRSSLADMGMVPYETDHGPMWNPHNYVTGAGETT